jgi:hypothetical protein
MSRSAIRLLTIVFLTTAFLLFLNGCGEITDELEDELRRETKRVIDELGDEAKEEIKKEIRDKLPSIQPVKPIAIEKPGTPILLSPAPDAKVDGSNFSIQWQKTSNATSYLLSVSRVIDNATIVVKEMVGTSFQMRLPNDGYTYRWRVTARGLGGWGPSSEWRYFQCGSTMKIPVPPTLISPADNSAVSGSSVVFQWTSVKDADSYYLYCQNANTGKVLINDKLGNVTSYTAQGFTNDGSTRYNWRVFAGNSLDWGKPSATWSFISGKSPDKAGKLSAPVLSVPAANANMPGDAISFEWGSTPSATGYGLTIQRLADHKVIVNIPVKGTTHRQGGFPNDGNQYRWRVAAYNQGDWGPASEWRIFTNGSVSPPPKPVLIAPKNNERVTDRTVTFSWQGSQQAKGYWLVVERVSDKEKIVNEEVKATSITKSGFPENGTQFRWQVFAHGSGGWSPASGWRTFTSGTASKPDSPQLKSPGNNATLGDGTIAFSWDEVSGASQYHLRIWNASTNATVIDEPVGKAINKSVSGIPLDGSKYNWQVFVWNSSGLGNSSKIWSFSTSAPSYEKIYDKAIKWAEGDPKRIPRDNPAYYRDCHRFVMDAYKNGGIDEKTLNKYQLDANKLYEKYKAKIEANKKRYKIPPKGSMVLYNLSQGPHTALSLGSGEIIHNNSDLSDQSSRVMVQKFNEKYLEKGYLGWLFPE